MTPEEYQKAINRLGWSQVKAGKVLGFDPRTSRRYALGESEIPESLARFIRLIVRLKLTEEDIK